MVGAQRATELAIAGVNGVHALCTGMQQGGREPPGRGADINRDCAADVDGERFERSGQLDIATQSTCGKKPDPGIASNPGVRVGDEAFVNQDPVLGEELREIGDVRVAGAKQAHERGEWLLAAMRRRWSSCCSIRLGSSSSGGPRARAGRDKTPAATAGMPERLVTQGSYGKPATPPSLAGGSHVTRCR